jgi:P4 family phage/plasmid primase-like protien
MSWGDIAAQSPAAVNNLTPYQAALWYRERGLCPIPWIARNGQKIAAFGKFSYDRYTSDPRALEWVLGEWGAHPEWQVGLALHENVGVFAVDVDSPEQLTRWERENGPLQAGTWTQITGRDGGGQHRLYRLGGRGAVWPKQGRFSDAYPNLEFRSNGLVGVAPSIHPSGRQYQWTADSPTRIATTNWSVVSLIAGRAASKDRSAVSGSTRAHVQPDGTRAVVASMDALLLGGVPAGQSQHETLRDLVWDAVSWGMSDVMVRVLWDTVVSRTPLSRPDHPWTDADFDRHLSGAREKLGGGIDPELMRWAVKVHNTPLVVAVPGQQAPEAPDTTPIASTPEKTARTAESWALRPMSFQELKQYGPHQEGMGRLFVDRFEDVFKWCNEEGAYYTWFSFQDKPVTSWDREGFNGVSPKFVYMLRKLGELVKDCVTQFVATLDQSTADGKQYAKDARAYQIPFQKADGLRGIAKIVVSDQRIAVTANDFTPRAHILNFLNGTYDVRTGELYPHRREDMNTVTINRRLDSAITDRGLEESAPVFASMLWRMCGAPGEVDLDVHTKRAEAIKRWLGYQLHGSNPEKKLGVFEGATSIGKNQIVEALGDIISEYAYTSCPPSLLVRSRMERHSSVEAGLAGKRMVIVNELTKGQVLDEGQVLRLVNPEGTRVDLRRMRENAVSTETTWKLTVTTNEMPRTDTTDQILERLAFFPLSKIAVPRENRDSGLKAQILDEESDAVLAYAVSWWRQWWLAHEAGDKNALALPQESDDTLKEFVEDNLTPLHEFLEEMCYVEAGAYIDAKDLWRKLAAYWDDQHRDKRLEYSGGRKELFKLASAISGVERRTKGARKNLVGFQNLRVRTLYGDAESSLHAWAAASTSV